MHKMVRVIHPNGETVVLPRDQAEEIRRLNPHVEIMEMQQLKRGRETRQA